MSKKNFLEKCNITKWFWWRILTMMVLFAGLSCYFFYDWKVGYPKKNYHLVQYDTFEKAREYFITHTKLGRTPEQWTSFVQGQKLQYFADKGIVEPSRKKDRWPAVLMDYSRLSSAQSLKTQSPNPLLWDEFFAERQKKISDLKSTFSDPLTKDDRKALKSEVRWDEPLPSEFQKGEYDANYRLVIYRTFQQAEELFKEHTAAGKSPEDWKFLVSCKDLAFEQDLSIVPLDKQDENWPSILGDHQRYFDLAKDDINSGISVKEPYLWEEYTSEKKWDQKPPKDYHNQDQVKEQMYFGIGVLALSALAGLFALRMKGRFMAVDEEAFYAPGNVRIPYADIYKVDKRKWETKGLATIFYKENGASKKARVDGMVYGQFNKDQGEPAEKLFQELLKHFKGEIVEFVHEESESEESESEL